MGLSLHGVARDKGTEGFSAAAAAAAASTPPLSSLEHIPEAAHSCPMSPAAYHLETEALKKAGPVQGEGNTSSEQ